MLLPTVVTRLWCRLNVLGSAFGGNWYARKRDGSCGIVRRNVDTNDVEAMSAGRLAVFRVVSVLAVGAFISSAVFCAVYTPICHFYTLCTGFMALCDASLCRYVPQNTNALTVKPVMHCDLPRLIITDWKLQCDRLTK